jgi:uncharacterized protein with von Willebrand factor type A (vWA) domain
VSLKERISGLLGRKRPKLEPNAIGHSKIDAAVLRDLRGRAPVLDEAFAPPKLEDGETLDADLWSHLVEDVFYSYFGQAEPTVRPRDEMDPKYFLNRSVASKHVRDEQFAEERPKTRTKGVPSALGTVGAIDSLRQSFEQELSEEAQRAQDMNDAQDDIDNLMEELERAQEAGRHEAELDDISGEVEAAEQRLEELVVEQAEAQADTSKKIEAAVKRAQERAGDAVEAANMVPGIGKEQGAGARVSADAMFKLVDRIGANDETRRALEMMGRIELDMGSTRREQRKGGFEDIVDIEFGDDMPRVLAHEKVLLMHPMGRMDFFRRYTERSLMQYETVEQRELKKGSVIFLNDGSYSMKGVKNVFSRAMTGACLGLAHRERRHFAAIEFGGPGQARCTRWPANLPIDPESVVEYMEQFYAGGTSTLTGMRMALDLLVNDAPFHTADLVVVTDGEDNVTAEDLEIRDTLIEMGVKIHGIAIGMAPTNYLLTICERTTSVSEYAGPNNATKQLAIDLT